MESTVIKSQKIYNLDDNRKLYSKLFYSMEIPYTSESFEEYRIKYGIVFVTRAGPFTNNRPLNDKNPDMGGVGSYDIEVLKNMAQDLNITLQPMEEIE